RARTVQLQGNVERLWLRNAFSCETQPFRRRKRIGTSRLLAARHIVAAAVVIAPVVAACRIGDDRAGHRANTGTDRSRADTTASRTTDGVSRQTANDRTITGTRAGRAASSQGAQQSQGNHDRGFSHLDLLSRGSIAQ